MPLYCLSTNLIDKLKRVFNHKFSHGFRVGDLLRLQRFQSCMSNFTRLFICDKFHTVFAK